MQVYLYIFNISIRYDKLRYITITDSFDLNKYIKDEEDLNKNYIGGSTNKEELAVSINIQDSEYDSDDRFLDNNYWKPLPSDMDIDL